MDSQEYLDRVYPSCPKCGHPVREHQPAYGAKVPHSTQATMGCSICNCQLTEVEKMRAWGGR